MTEAAADEGTRLIYAQIRRAMGESAVTLFYSVLGTYPGFLQTHWSLFGPLACSQELLALAERLRADAYTRAHNYLPLQEAQPGSEEASLSQRARQALACKVDLFQQRAAGLLLLFSAQMQALDGPVGREGRPTPASAPELAQEEALGERVADEQAQEALREIPRALDVPYLNPEYAALACEPGFLRGYWERLKCVLQSPLYRECQYGVRESAWMLARELPGPIETSQLSEAMEQEEIASVGRILELFVKNLSGLVLNMAIARIVLEGGKQQLPEVTLKACRPGRAA